MLFKFLFIICIFQVSRIELGKETNKLNKIQKKIKINFLGNKKYNILHQTKRYDHSHSSIKRCQNEYPHKYKKK